MNAPERQALEDLAPGRVLSGREMLRYYSVDASTYQVMPRAVVVPRDGADVAAVVRFAARNSVPVTARGAGTSLAGNSLNRGIILDMKRLDSLLVRGSHAIVGPGLSKGRLDEELKRRGMFFPPNPSIGRFCTVGGMLGNNSSGSRSLKYGSTVDNVLEVTFVDGRGRIQKLPGSGALGRRISSLARRMDRSMMPQVTKNSSGYRMEDACTPEAAHKVLVGSEGTLGIILSAKIRIQSIPRRRVLYVIGYGSARDAASDCPCILATGPSALELVDAQTLDADIAGGAGCLLFAEYDSCLKTADRHVRRAAAGRIMHKADTEEDMAAWWRTRDASLHRSLKSVRPEDVIPHIIEDAAVPVERLPELFDLIGETNLTFGTRAITYGHAGNGNIHVRLLARDLGGRDLGRLARFYFKRVIELGGSVSGEHGDGIARTKFVAGQYGRHNHGLFVLLKDLLDPHGILNPGKIVAAGRQRGASRERSA